MLYSSAYYLVLIIWYIFNFYFNLFNPLEYYDTQAVIFDLVTAFRSCVKSFILKKKRNFLIMILCIELMFFFQLAYILYFFQGTPIMTWVSFSSIYLHKCGCWNRHRRKFINCFLSIKYKYQLWVICDVTRLT